MSLWFLLPTSLGQNVRPWDLSAPYPPVVMVIPVQTTLFYVKVNVTASLMRLGGSGRQESCPPFRYCESEVKVTQLCPTLCDPMDSSVHGILQARILEWVAFPFSRGSSQPRDQTQVSHIAGRCLTSVPPGKLLIEVKELKLAAT